MADLDEAAPHGRDDQGVPLAPFGHRADGRPKLSNRGRTAKAPQKRPAAARSSSRSRSHEQTKAQLTELVSMFTTPIAAATLSPAVKKRLGEKHATALAGDMVIVEAYADPLADAVIQLSQTKPGVLAWMDQVEEKAPYLALLQVGAQMAKAIIGNHMHPDERLASAGRRLAPVRAARYAAAIQEEAEALGVEIPEQRTPAAA
ncbi:hypothetical protein [Streptomyces sp. NPDC056264]|uniref:hypothetical protein n=1 Tax=Streptomyces sp. NPDC056264 TaxID=3345767 RepID=UPI003AB0176B